MLAVRIGTRGSQLALWQANHVAKLITENFPRIETELVTIKTEADRRLDVLLSEVGGKGLFIKELEVALLEHRIDIAVHSMKDVTVDLADDFEIAAILKRGNPYDALVSTKYSSLDELPAGAAVGTCSLRRRSQLLNVRPDLKIVPVRGNVLTRLKRLDDGEFDAIVLAVSGLQRLGLGERITQVLDQPPHIPSPGQGALGIECRRKDLELIADMRALNDSTSHVAVAAERSVNAGLGGSCNVPVGIHAQIECEKLNIAAYVSTVDATNALTQTASGLAANSMTLADEIVGQLNARGAQQILAG